MNIRQPPKEIGTTGKGSSRRWGRRYDKQAPFPTFECADYETLLEKLAAIGMRPHRDDLKE